DLFIQTGKSSIDVNLSAQFQSINELINHPDNSHLSLNLKKFILDLNDLFDFEPALKENEYLKKLAQHRFTGEIRANGKLSEVDLTKFAVNWGENTKIRTNGQFQNLIDIDQ